MSSVEEDAMASTAVLSAVLLRPISYISGTSPRCCNIHKYSHRSEIFEIPYYRLEGTHLTSRACMSCEFSGILQNEKLT
jgi:hypothetical protein